MHIKDIYNSNYEDTKARLRLLYDNAIGGLFVTYLCMLVFCFAFDTPEQQNIKNVIFIIYTLSHILRLIDNFYSRKILSEDSPNLNPIKLRLVIGIVVNSLIFMVFSSLFVSNMQGMEITVTAVVLSALAGGTVTILAASTTLSMFYVSCLLLPFAIAGLYSNLEYLNYVSFLAAIFWGVMLVSSKQAGAFLTEVLLLKAKNAEMLSLMDIEKQEVVRINMALTTANDQLDKYTNTLEEKVEQRTNQIHKLSNIDPLTTLTNRTAFGQHLRRTLYDTSGEVRKHCLLFIDLNGFKDVNDGFGHRVGDIVLSEIAQRLLKLRSFSKIGKLDYTDAKDDFICRWGGDEFLMLAEYVTLDRINELVILVQRAIQEPISASSNNIVLSASIGISLYPANSLEPNELIQFADISMYQHKEAQTGQAVYFSRQLLEEFQHNQTIRDGLKNALDKNEFNLVYHPIVDVQSNQVWAFEALIRWEHDGLSISPNEFIPIAEKAGHINKIGAWVLICACKEAASWDFSPSVSVSVNVSAVQLLDEHFISVVEGALAESKLSPSRLHIEITESVMLENNELAKKHLSQISERGIHISVDDFGTGYSSLNQLHNLSFDVIKIDRSFIKDLDKKDRMIISAAKSIADEFNASTVAEGIETQEELAVLKALNIRYIQGFLFAKPMPENALKDWHANEFKVI